MGQGRFPTKMKTSIITVTYDKDLEFLKYNLKSIKKFCKGYHENIVIIYDYKNDCSETQKYLDSIGQKYFINKESKHIDRGYIRQQYLKLNSDKYVSEDTDYICHIDSDSLFKKEHTPDVYFRNGKPILVKVLYEKLFPYVKNELGGNPGPFKVWQDTTSAIMGLDVKYEFMFRMPLVYPKSLFKKTREYIQTRNGEKDLVDILKDIKMMSEYNVLGAYAYEFMRDEFFWIDRWEQQSLISETTFRHIFGQYSSREIQQADRYVDLSKKDNELDKILSDNHKN